MEQKKSSHISKGLVIALIMIVIDLVAGFAGVKMEVWFRWIPSLVMFIAFIIACVVYSNEMENRVTFGNIFGHGFKASMVVAAILVVYTILSIYVIFPNMKEQLLQMQMQELDKKNIPEAQKEQAMTMMKKMFVPIAFMAAILGTLLVGAIGSLIGAAFAKKKPLTPSFDQNN